MSLKVTLVEAIWTFSSILGLGISLPCISDSRKDLKKAVDVIPIVRLMAKSNLRNEAFRGLTLLIFSVVGCISLLLPNSPITPVGRIVGWALVLVNISIVYNTIQDRRMRLALNRYYANE